MKNDKFSIIIPVYNTEEFLVHCLDSIINQSHRNIEIIVVNDGSKGNCDAIIKKYKNIVYIKEKNLGLSEARNNGVKKASGDYILFLDSDDFLDKDLLWIINSEINDEDVIRFQLRFINDNAINNSDEKGFKDLAGPEAFEKICHYKYVENATLYAYKRSYWMNNNYKFEKGKKHEDFGLIPKVIFNASKVKSLEYIGYNYVDRSNSIMNSNDRENAKVKAFDTLEQGLENINYIDNVLCDNKYKRIFKSFIANSIFIKANSVSDEYLKNYIDIVKNNNLLNYLLDDTIKRKIKKKYYQIKYKL